MNMAQITTYIGYAMVAYLFYMLYLKFKQTPQGKKFVSDAIGGAKKVYMILFKGAKIVKDAPVDKTPIPAKPVIPIQKSNVDPLWKDEIKDMEVVDYGKEKQ